MLSAFDRLEKKQAKRSSKLPQQLAFRITIRTNTGSGPSDGLRLNIYPRYAGLLR